MCFLLDFNEERQAVVVYQVPKEITEVQKIEEEGLFRKLKYDEYMNRTLTGTGTLSTRQSDHTVFVFCSLIQENENFDLLIPLLYLHNKFVICLPLS